MLVLAAVALATAGCSTPTRVDSGPIRAHTFSFMDPGPRQRPAYADNSQPIHAMIQQAIATNLTTHGVTRMDKGGDVTVAYLLIIGDNASTISINEYFGLRDDAANLQDKAHEAYTGNANPNHFEAGTLVIDIIDAKTYKLLKRGYATRPVLRNISNEARAARIQEAVDDILRDLRVER